MSANKDILHQLEVLIRSRYSLIFFNTQEEERAGSLLRLLADHMNIPFFTWSLTKGLVREDIESKAPVYKSRDILLCLGHIESSSYPAIYHFKSLESFLEDRKVVEKFKNISADFTKKDAALIISGNSIEIPEQLKLHSARVNMPDPSVEEYRQLLHHIIRDLKFTNNLSVDLTPEQETQLLNNISGLTLTEAEKILTKVMVVDNMLSEDDIREVIDSKKEIIEKEGVLEYYPIEESMQGIAGLENLKDWLGKRKKIITSPDSAKEFGLSFPRGILVLGVPGCGKSLCAKAVAMEWGLPLLKFDTANLYNKYIGETEKNLKRAIETSEKMSPVVLWIDEIEKAFSSATAESDGGVSTRIFGTFLSWMQERESDVFIFATANDVSKLPPEFLRKGRFDEIFFVDLPDRETRKRIFEIHLLKRDKNPDGFDLDNLSEITGGFTGSEIEQLIVSVLFTAFSKGEELSTELLIEEAKNTTPISVTMAERISELRNWAEGRTVKAN